MEKLVHLCVAMSIVAAVLYAFLAGAVANLFGFDFWSVAPIVGLAALAFFAGRMSGS
jgi:hypothetical protein